MAGHSHWKGIQHKKALVDAKRGKLYSKLARLVTVAARAGGGDPDMNAKLALAVSKARAANMTKDAIERAIKKGTGELEGVHYEELAYEGYGPGGVALIVEALTDNRARTAGEIRKIFEKRGGTFGAPGSVAWQFEVKGVVAVGAEGADEEKLMELVVASDGEDLRRVDDQFHAICEPRAVDALRAAIEGAGFAVASAEPAHLPKTTVPVEGAAAEKLMGLIDDLDDHDDVQKVHANYEIKPEELARLAAAAG